MGNQEQSQNSRATMIYTLLKGFYTDIYGEFDNEIVDTMEEQESDEYRLRILVGLLCSQVDMRSAREILTYEACATEEEAETLVGDNFDLFWD